MKKTFLNLLNRQPSGMAMVIVLTVAFVVLITVAAGAVIISNNLNKSGGQASKARAEESVSIALERLKGIYKIDGALLKTCSQGDCVDLTNGVCVSCSDAAAFYKQGDVKYKVELGKIAQPEGLTVGFADLVVTGYYKNISKQKSTRVCLNYCAGKGFTCGDNGCGGTCGTCRSPQTCDAGTQKCSGEVVTGCGDINVECATNCPVGTVCGGGTVVDDVNYIVVSDSGCDSGSCNQSTDYYTRIWDEGHFSDTGANDQSDGRNNMSHLTSSQYSAALYCSDAAYNNFSDWYLPSNEELLTLYNASQNAYGTGYAQDGCYWSSSQYDKGPIEAAVIGGFGENFNSCRERIATTKSENTYTRCIRRYNTQAAACSDVNTECTADCVAGDRCGGGALIDVSNHVIASLSGCDGSTCSETTDNAVRAWESNAIIHDFTNAQDPNDGKRNTDTIVAFGPNFDAALMCSNASYYGFGHWWLPAINELETMYNASSSNWTSGYADACYWSSTEEKRKADVALIGGMGAKHGMCPQAYGKADNAYVRCLRRW
ncbi:MAG: DUF1566 domain-containing protein [Candidatus Falkowbacteria bacterium]|nr:DUF1566 domain-containing protein [Candidatus Falkowbacteria bacterium]